MGPPKPHGTTTEEPEQLRSPMKVPWEHHRSTMGASKSHGSRMGLLYGDCLVLPWDFHGKNAVSVFVMGFL